MWVRFPPPAPTFNVTPPGWGGGMRTLPDGSFTMTNQPMTSILNAASPVQVVEVMGMPGWAKTERYDIVARAPEGSTRRSGDLRHRSLERPTPD